MAFDGEVCCFCGLPITTDVTKPWEKQGVWHHYDESLRHTDRKLYLQTFGTKNEFTVPAHNDCHGRHHGTGRKLTVEERAKVSKSKIGRNHYTDGVNEIVSSTPVEGFRLGGKKRPAKSTASIAKTKATKKDRYPDGIVTTKGKKPFNNGTVNIYAETCPDGFVPGFLFSEGARSKMGGAKGKHWFNNGETEILALECPPGYVRGRPSLNFEHGRRRIIGRHRPPIS